VHCNQNRKKKVMATMLPSPSLVARSKKQKKGDGNDVAIAFSHVLQLKKNKEGNGSCCCFLWCATSKKQKTQAMATMLLSPSLLRYNKNQKKGNDNVVAIAFFGAPQAKNNKKGIRRELTSTLGHLWVLLQASSAQLHSYLPHLLALVLLALQWLLSSGDGVSVKTIGM
jgi:hypothetical protein